MLWSWFKNWWWPKKDPPLLDPRNKIQDSPRTLEELNNIIHYPPRGKVVEFKLP